MKILEPRFSKLFITFVIIYVIINHGYLLKQNVELEKKRNLKKRNDGLNTLPVIKNTSSFTPWLRSFYNL